MRIIPRVLPGVVAGALLLGGASGVFAAKAGVHAHRVHRVLVAGQVSGLQSAANSPFTVTFTPKKAGVAAKTYAVATTSATKERASKGTTGTLQNGEYAIVVGQKTTTGITARSVFFSTTAFKGRQVKIMRLRLRLGALTAIKVQTMRGTVSATPATTGTLAVTRTSKKGVVVNRTFAITATTKYFVGKTAASSAPTFTSGEKVIVRFKRDKATKALNALAIRVASA